MPHIIGNRVLLFWRQKAVKQKCARNPRLNANTIVVNNSHFTGRSNEGANSLTNFSNPSMLNSICIDACYHSAYPISKRNLADRWRGSNDAGSTWTERGGSAVKIAVKGRVLTLPTWDLDGGRLSKSSDCRSSSDRTASQITDSDCVALLSDSSVTLDFNNVSTSDYNVYIDVNGSRQVSEPSQDEIDEGLGLRFSTGVNVLRVRLARKGAIVAQNFGSDAFYFKVPNLDRAPTADNNTVSTREDTAYTFEADDFNLSDADEETLSSVKIVTPPVVGTLALDGTTVAANRSVTKAEIDDGMLVFTPEMNANGADYSSFTFRLDDGSAESEQAYVMTIDVTAVNDPPEGKPTITGNAVVGQTPVALTYGISDVEESFRFYSYRWVRVDGETETEISGATSRRYTLTAAEAGKTIKVKVSYTDEGGTNESVTSDAYPHMGTISPVVDFLVSNLDQYHDDFDAVGLPSYNRTLIGHAFSFTTGDNPGGYKISAVRLHIGAVSDTTPRVSIYSDSSGRPGTSLKVLGNPADIPSMTQTQYDGFYFITDDRDFDADGFTLGADTRYWVVIERASGSGAVVFSFTGSDSEDTGTAPGWTIGDIAFTRKEGQTWSNAVLEYAPERHAIKGEPVTSLSTDATLSDLVLKDASNAIVPIGPNFAPAETSYTATVVNSVSRIKLEPTRSDSNSTIKYLNNSEVTLTDADTNTGLFDFDLGVGSNILKVKVTAQDGTSMQTYTITVNRQAATNSKARGAPTILGITQVERTLTASTSGISDGNGLNRAVFSYQWIRSDGVNETNIPDANSLRYTLTAEDLGKRIRVRVSFTDDLGYGEELKSDTTTVVVEPEACPEVQLDPGDLAVCEDQSIQLTITLAESPEESVYIPYRFTDNSETSYADYDAIHGGYNLGRSGHFRFSAGETEKTLSVTAEEDDVNDDGESFRFSLGPLPDEVMIGAGEGSRTVHIIDTDDPNSVTVSFRYGNYYAPEDGSPAWVPVAVEPVPDREITIPITFTRGGGLSEDDHSTVTKNVTFGPDVRGGRLLSDDRTYASRPIEIWALDDSLDDDGEYMDLTFGPIPDAFVSEDTDLHGGGKKTEGFWRPANQSRVWFQDNEFTPTTPYHR